MYVPIFGIVVFISSTWTKILQFVFVINFHFSAVQCFVVSNISIGTSKERERERERKLGIQVHLLIKI